VLLVVFFALLLTSAPPYPPLDGGRADRAQRRRPREADTLAGGVLLSCALGAASRSCRHRAGRRQL
jgi:hypothetical protein